VVKVSYFVNSSSSAVLVPPHAALRTAPVQSRAQVAAADIEDQNSFLEPAQALTALADVYRQTEPILLSCGESNLS
jgi:hypothetical protein